MVEPALISTSRISKRLFRRCSHDTSTLIKQIRAETKFHFTERFHNLEGTVETRSDYVTLPNATDYNITITAILSSLLTTEIRLHVPTTLTCWLLVSSACLKKKIRTPGRKTCWSTSGRPVSTMARLLTRQLLLAGSPYSGSTPSSKVSKGRKFASMAMFLHCTSLKMCRFGHHLWYERERDHNHHFPLRFKDSGVGIL